MAIKFKDMAIQFKEIQNTLKNAPLSELELKYIAEAEEYIDTEITKQFGTPANSVSIDLLIPTFKYSMKRKSQLDDVPSIRKPILQKELENRYKTAGWRITLHIDDGLDGPNMSGSDYWVLNGR